MIVVIGAGSFGLAIAVSFARRNWPVTLLSRRDFEACEAFNTRRHLLTHPNTDRPETLSMTNDVNVLHKATRIVMAVPTQQLSLVANEYAAYLKDRPVLLLQKGIDIKAGNSILIKLNQIGTVTETIQAVKMAHKAGMTAIISHRPNFADEIIGENPSVTSIVSTEEKIAQQWADMLESDSIATYVKTDIIGTQLAGAIKNVVAIAAGIIDALGCGANTLAAVITKGIQEAVCLGKSMGADTHTFFEPAGIGDFTLTCHTSKSRN